ncbi:hypothetical protein oki361_21770 [Helicobacter pylori]
MPTFLNVIYKETLLIIINKLPIKIPTNNAFQLKILTTKNNTSVNQSKTLLTLK